MHCLIVARIDSVFDVRPFYMPVKHFPCDVLLCPAAIGVISSYDALLDPFECSRNFLRHLEVYTRIHPPVNDQYHHQDNGRITFCTCTGHETNKVRAVQYVRRHIHYIFGGSTDHREICEKLLGDNEIEAALHRLGGLTEDEARMTLAKTLGVVYGLVGNIKSWKVRNLCVLVYKYYSEDLFH